MVSLVDLLPTLLDLATDGNPPDYADPLDGASMADLLSGGRANRPAAAISEYTDMGVCAPARMIRRGRYKYVYVYGQKPQLCDLEADPDELADLSGRVALADEERSLNEAVLRGWDPAAVERDVLQSQRRRLFLKEAARRSGRFPDWSFQACKDDSKRFVRGGGASGAKALSRFPFVPPPASK